MIYPIKKLYTTKKGGVEEMLKSSKGFTLIELLIVIVIIGILAGVLIAVIDPTKQQNRARDAGVQATINKAALAAEGFRSAYGRAPEGDEFINSLQNAGPRGGADCNAGSTTCLFDVTGNILSVNCDGGRYQGQDSDTNQCYFRYEQVSVDQFRLYGRSFGISGTTFMYDNQAGEITECGPGAAAACP